MIMVLFKSGDELIVLLDLYGGMYCLFENEWKKYGLIFYYDDFSDEDCLCFKIMLNIKVVFVEILINLFMQEVDIEKIVWIIKEYGFLLIVDNIFYILVLQWLFELGVDIVIYSVIKYLGGYNDLFVGFVVVKDEKFGEEMF